MMKRRNEQKDSLNVEQVFDVAAKRYDAWYDKPFGKSAFTLEKVCIESLFKNLKQPFLEVGMGTGRFANALKIGYGIDDSSLTTAFFEANYQASTNRNSQSGGGNSDCCHEQRLVRLRRHIRLGRLYGAIAKRSIHFNSTRLRGFKKSGFWSRW
jgi:hypothetical protein